MINRNISVSYFIPKDWVEDLEMITGQKMIKMWVIVNGGLKLEPIFENGKVLPKIPPAHGETVCLNILCSQRIT